MQILFIHRNFPAQFGQLAAYLALEHKVKCNFASESPSANLPHISQIQYQPVGGVRESTHFSCRTFENQIRASEGLRRALVAQPHVRPDLIVAHSGFVSPLFLRDLYDCPVINYFEYFYRPRDSDINFRPEFPMDEAKCMRAQARNAMLLLDLDNCDAGYSPTRWQKDRFPREFQHKISQLFDGVETNFWRPQPDALRQIAGHLVPANTRIVTYVSRGLEAMRGFDVFMKLAKRLCEARSDVLFFVVGEDRTNYGDDLAFTGGASFKDWVLAQDDYDLNRIRFLGRLAPAELANLLAITDLHVYLTVPFVLSWSLINAMSCGATILASAVPPVEEVIQSGVTGLLSPLDDLDRLTALAGDVLEAPVRFRDLGFRAREAVVNHYSNARCLPRIWDFFEEAVAKKRPPAGL